MLNTVVHHVDKMHAKAIDLNDSGGSIRIVDGSGDGNVITLIVPTYEAAKAYAQAINQARESLELIDTMANAMEASHGA